MSSCVSPNSYRARTIGHFMPYRRAARKQAALRTSDFDIACGHLMVVMAARIFLKRQGRRINESFIAAFLGVFVPLCLCVPAIRVSK